MDAKVTIRIVDRELVGPEGSQFVFRSVEADKRNVRNLVYVLAEVGGVVDGELLELGVRDRCCALVTVDRFVDGFPIEIFQDSDAVVFCRGIVVFLAVKFHFAIIDFPTLLVLLFFNSSHFNITHMHWKPKTSIRMLIVDGARMLATFIIHHPQVLQPINIILKTVFFIGH